MRSTQRSALVLSTILAVILLGVGSRCWGQAVVPGVSTSAPRATVGGAISVTDFFIGRNVVGPYLLSWKNIEPNSETILRNGRRLTRNLDYRIDATSGTLTFSTRLGTRDIAQVDYYYKPGKAVANSAPAILPMQFNLLNAGGSGLLNLEAIYRPEALGPTRSGSPVTPGGQGQMLLGLTGNAKLFSGRSSLASRLFVDTRGGNLLDHSAMQIRQESSTRIGQFSAGFTRAGSDFWAGKETGIMAGKQVVEAAGTLNLLSGVQACATFQQTTDLPKEGKGGTTTVLGQRLAATLGAGMRLQATRLETSVEGADGSNMVKIANRFQVDKTLSGSASATAVIERNRTDVQGVRREEEVNSLTIKARPDERVAVQGTVQTKKAGEEQEQGAQVQVDATPTKTIRLSAFLSNKTLTQPDRTLNQYNRAGYVEFTPVSAITLSGGFEIRTVGSEESTTQTFKGTVRPVSGIEVSGGAKLRDMKTEGQPDPGTVDSYDVKVSVGLIKNSLRLTGGYADNPEDEKGIVSRVRRHSVGVQSSLGAFDFSGGYSLENQYLSTQTNTILDLNLGYRLGRSTQILTGFRQTESLATDLETSDTYSFSLTHQVSGVLDLMLTGSMTTYQKNGLFLPYRDYKAELRLGLRF